MWYYYTILISNNKPWKFTHIFRYNSNNHFLGQTGWTGTIICYYILLLLNTII